MDLIIFIALVYYTALLIYFFDWLKFKWDLLKSVWNEFDEMTRYFIKLNLLYAALIFMALVCTINIIILLFG